VDSADIRWELANLTNRWEQANFTNYTVEHWNLTDINEDKERGLGFVDFENQNGKCALDFYLPTHVNQTAANSTEDDDFEEIPDKFGDYQELLGSDWLSKRNTGIAAAALAWFFWLWLLIMACKAHTRMLRWVVGFLIGVVLTCLQGTTFGVLNSDLCDQYGCKMGQSAMFAITSTTLFFLTGIVMFFTKDHSPRISAQQVNNEKAMIVLPAAPNDEEVIYSPDGTAIIANHQEEIPIAEVETQPEVCTSNIEAQVEQEVSTCSENLSRKQAILMRNTSTP
jgi:hypothetical protein